MAQKSQQIEWARYAEIAYVNFGWSPDQFWRATPVDFWCAYRGWRKVHGGGTGEDPLNRSELNDLLRKAY